MNPNELLEKLLGSPLKQRLTPIEKQTAHNLLLKAWRQAAQNATPEQLAQGAAEWEEFNANMNAKREFEGRIELFP